MELVNFKGFVFINVLNKLYKKVLLVVSKVIVGILSYFGLLFFMKDPFLFQLKKYFNRKQ